MTKHSLVLKVARAAHLLQSQGPRSADAAGPSGSFTLAADRTNRRRLNETHRIDHAVAFHPGAATATLPTIVFARALGLGVKLAASERIGIGVIGTVGCTYAKTS